MAAQPEDDSVDVHSTQDGLRDGDEGEEAHVRVVAPSEDFEVAAAHPESPDEERRRGANGNAPERSRDAYGTGAEAAMALFNKLPASFRGWMDSSPRKSTGRDG